VEFNPYEPTAEELENEMLEEMLDEHMERHEQEQFEKMIENYEPLTAEEIEEQLGPFWNDYNYKPFDGGEGG
jgi:predicted Holliday junction resolvase-like endonuclease